MDRLGSYMRLSNTRGEDGLNRYIRVSGKGQVVQELCFDRVPMLSTPIGVVGCEDGLGRYTYRK